MKKLAILGASYLQLPLFEKAKEMGIETHCFAWDNDLAVCKSIADYFYPYSVLDEEAILEICQKVKIDGITTIATDICVPTIAYVANAMGLIGNAIDSAKKATNKALMRNAFSQNEVNTIQYQVLEASNLSFTNNFALPIIVKPTDRSGSRGVSKVTCPDELQVAFQRAIKESLEKRIVVEEFIEGVEVSVETISWKGEHYLLAITDKITTGAPYFVEIEHHQPSQLESSILAKIKDQTFKVLDALDIQFGAAHSEFKITKEGTVYAIEVGARMGGDFIGSDLVQLATGYDFVKGVIEIALGDFSIPKHNPIRYSGVYFLAKETENLLPFFHKENDFDFRKAILNPELITIKDSNDRSGYLIYKSSKKIIL